jgi:2-haloacid dehalogenase
MNQYRSLSAFPENREVLQALKARGMVTGILSNGDPDDAAAGGESRPAWTACWTM